MDILNSCAQPPAELPAHGMRLVARAFCRTTGVSLGQVERETCNNVAVRAGDGTLRNYRSASVSALREIVHQPRSPEFSPGHPPIGMPWEAGP